MKFATVNKSILLLPFVLSILSLPAAGALPTTSVVPASAPIRLDGLLDERDWQSAGVIPDLTQQSPRPGEPTPFQTTVYFLRDADTLYVGFECLDPEPEKIRVHTQQRDGNQAGDDSVAIVLDTFDDGMTGYLFRFNTAAARVDALISGPVQPSLDWDGIWSVAVKTSPRGWTAELAIPMRTLRFAKGKDTWGLNVQRFVPRKQMVLRWSGATLDSQFFALNRAGKLTGVAGFVQGLGLSAAPYGLLRREDSATRDAPLVKGQAGIDVGYNPSPDLGAVLTINTDFAETDVDTRQLNLTRFPLFFPEKRAFFLEGSNQFEFGLGLGTTFIPFYSRRVGLVGTDVVPIDAGLKVLGRVGALAFALLDVEMRDTAVSERTNLFAGRLRYDLSRSFRLGAIATYGDPKGVVTNGLYGMDVEFHTARALGNKNFDAGAWLARSTGDVPPGKSTGWGFKLDFPNDLWKGSFRLAEFGEALRPLLGFLPRPGTRQYESVVAFQPRPGKASAAGSVQQFFFQLEWRLVDRLDGTLESARWGVTPFAFQTRKGDRLDSLWAPQTERLTAPFKVASGVVIPPGRYDFDRGKVSVQSSPHRTVEAGAAVGFGTFYDGRLSELSGYAGFTEPSGHLQLRLDALYNSGTLPAGGFIQRLWQLKTVYAFTPDLILSAYGQYDSETRNMGWNTRLRYSPAPGRDFYLVWNHGWVEPAGSASASFQPVSDEIVAKIRWTGRW